MFLLEEITNVVRLTLAAIQMTARAGHHLRGCLGGFPPGRWLTS